MLRKPLQQNNAANQIHAGVLATASLSLTREEAIAKAKAKYGSSYTQAPTGTLHAIHTMKQQIAMDQVKHNLQQNPSADPTANVIVNVDQNTVAMAKASNAKSEQKHLRDNSLNPQHPFKPMSTPTLRV